MRLRGGGSNAMEAIIEEEQRQERVAEARRERELRQEHWLHEGIVVKVGRCPTHASQSTGSMRASWSR
jgi:hypothetical protein